MGERVTRATLRADLSEVARGRRIAAEALAAWGDDAALPAVELLVSEMVGAAVRRAGGDVELRLRSSGDAVVVEVAEPPCEPGEAALWFAEDVATDWGRVDASGRTVTWARVTAGRVAGHAG
jgi:hypothetical protein